MFDSTSDWLARCNPSSQLSSNDTRLKPKSRLVNTKAKKILFPKREWLIWDLSRIETSSSWATAETASRDAKDWNSPNERSECPDDVIVTSWWQSICRSASDGNGRAMESATCSSAKGTQYTDAIQRWWRHHDAVMTNLTSSCRRSPAWAFVSGESDWRFASCSTGKDDEGWRHQSSFFALCRSNWVNRLLTKRISNESISSSRSNRQDCYISQISCVQIWET